MTGRRPDRTEAWNFLRSFRDVGPRWVTLPSHFRDHGYLTLGTGKLYHEGLPANGDGNLSWSDLPQQFSCVHSGTKGAGTYCDPDMKKCTGSDGKRWCAVDVAMNTTEDGQFCDIDTLNDAMMKLKFAAENKKTTGQPFFLGVG